MNQDRQQRFGWLSPKRSRSSQCSDALITGGWTKAWGPDVFDLIMVDFPDPTNFLNRQALHQLFYALLEKHLSGQRLCRDPGHLATFTRASPSGASSPPWRIASASKSTPYHALRAFSFGEWGYIIGSRPRFRLPPQCAFRVATRYITADTMKCRCCSIFPKDMSRVPAEVNRLNEPGAGDATFEEEWRKVPSRIEAARLHRASWTAR